MKKKSFRGIIRISDDYWLDCPDSNLKQMLLPVSVSYQEDTRTFKNVNMVRTGSELLFHQ